MKTIISTILFLFTLTACAADRITATLTVTNTPVYGDTLVANAKTLNWTNSTAGAPSTSVLIGANIGASATNLFRQLASYPLTGPVNVGFSSSNVLTFVGQPGQAMTFSMAGTWATLTLSTQAVTTMTAVRVPASGEPTQSSATNIYSLVATGLSTHSTNALTSGTTLVQNLVQTTGAQDVGGVKNLTSMPQLRSNLLLTNSAGSYIDIWASGAGADAKGLRIYSEESGFTISLLDDAGAVGDNIMVVTRTGAIVDLISFGGPINASLLQNCILTNNTAHNLSATNTTFYTNTIVTGNISYTRANHTSLANGNNAGVDFGTKVYIKIKAGPSAAFAICGITGGSDGRMLILDNSIAQNMTISNDSGVEPTAANRIYTRTGADITTTGQAVVTLIYDSEDSRWIVVSVRD